jgi:uncharacterized protein YbjT (DUF2867 family)
MEAKMDSKTIVICGATGNIGSAVVESLLRKKLWNIVALSRNPDGAKARALNAKGIKVIKADLQDKASLVSAFRGAHYVFGITQPFSSDYKKSDPKGEVVQGTNIIDSCIENRIEHLVLSTVFGHNEQTFGVSHLDSKTIFVEYLKKTNVQYIILKPASFMDNIGTSFFPVRKGTIRGLTDKDVQIPYIAVKDIGEFARLVFEQPDLYLKSELNLIADLVSGEELAKMLSRIRNGERFKYTTIPRLVMRLFAKEFYEMRVSFEKAGRPPYSLEYSSALKICKEMRPEIISLEQYLISQGYGSKQL